MSRKEALELAKACVLASYILNYEKREVIAVLNKEIQEEEENEHKDK